MSSTSNVWETDIIPRSILFGNPEQTGARISPDGKMLAYLAPSNGVLNIWVRELDGSDARVITSDTQRPIRAFFWQPGGRGVVHIQDQGGDENFHVFLTDVQTRVTKDLTPFAGARADILDVDRNFPDEMLVTINARDPQYFDVHRIDLRTGEITLDTQNPGDVAGWTTDNSMQVRVAHVIRPDGGTTLRLLGADKSWKTIIEADAEDILDAYGFDHLGRLLLVSSVGVNSARLLAYSVENASFETLAEDPLYDVSGTITNPKTHIIEAIGFERERLTWTNIAPEIANDLTFLKTVSHGDLHLVSRDLSDTKWTVQFIVDNGPSMFYLYERAEQKATFLFTTQPALERYTLAHMEPIAFDARDGLKIHGYLTMPPQKQGPVPMVLLVHGGPWARDSWGYRPDTQWLANRGYGVLQVNYRGSTGYGKAHLNAGDREWAGKMHDDLLDAKAWAIAQGYADPRRFAIYGGSYGGYAVLVALAFTPGEFTCGVDIVGPSSLLTLIDSIPPYWAPALAQFKRRLGDPITDEQFLRDRSPLYKADAIVDPLLIGQGANDPRVKIAESDQIVKAMREKQKTVEYLVFEDEGHGFARPENRMRFYAAVELFFAKHLGGRAEAAQEHESAELVTR